MATFFGGEQLNAVTKITGTSGTIYTVPADNFARIKVMTLNTSSSLSITFGTSGFIEVDAAVNVSGGLIGPLGDTTFALVDLSTSVGNFTEDIIMSSGEIISLSAAFSSVTIYAFEYANP